VVYADDVNILVGGVHTIKENDEEGDWTRSKY
jgi:hypothetical protein